MTGGGRLTSRIHVDGDLKYVVVVVVVLVLVLVRAKVERKSDYVI